jgi:hypothetical protein
LASSQYLLYIYMADSRSSEGFTCTGLKTVTLGSNNKAILGGMAPRNAATESPATSSTEATSRVDVIHSRLWRHYSSMMRLCSNYSGCSRAHSRTTAVLSQCCSYSCLALAVTQLSAACAAMAATSQQPVPSLPRFPLSLCAEAVVASAQRL